MYYNVKKAIREIKQNKELINSFKQFTYEPKFLIECSRERVLNYKGDYVKKDFKKPSITYELRKTDLPKL